VSALPRDAVLPLDKPEGPTSHDMVALARRALGERRVGHSGTLDPFASGLLLLCVGRATRLAQYLSGMDKTYEATARLGVATDTEDRDGEVVAESEGWRDVTAAAVDAALDGLRGDILQRPPRFSAKKVEGEAAHRRARRGEDLRLDSVPVTVHELVLTSFEPPEVGVRVRCSSGTYVRSLARDLGDALGVGAHLTRLRRTAVGAFDVADALAPDDLGDEARVGGAWIDPLRALGHMPRVDVDGAAAADLGHGRAVPVEGIADGGPAAAAHGGTLVAVGMVRDATFRPRKVFAHG
jgi:tRNA pseudouridine55 synthase